MATELQKLRRFMLEVVLAHEGTQEDEGKPRLPDLIYYAYERFNGPKFQDPARLLRGIRKAGVCPCQTIVDNPGLKHIKACPFSDPDYEP